MPTNSTTVPETIYQRWDEIRRNPDCDLSLAPKTVAKYLEKGESTIVRERIVESLSQLADYRLHEGNYHSGNETGGDLATCEGLETFLVPAVEEAYKFSDFLNRYSKAGVFAEKFRDDVNALLGNWTKKPKPEFSGRPYTDLARVRKAVEQTLRTTLEPFNITESAAIACRVIIHILTLKYRNEGEERFQNDIGKALKDDDLVRALSNAVDFLVSAFQKTSSDGSDEEKIAKATWKDFPGSGWSWTAGGSANLPPLLFFTAAVVDAYADLDFYLIRPGFNNEFQHAPVLQKLFTDNKDRLRQLQLCVDMSRRWVKQTVLPNLAAKRGQHEEKYPDREQTKIVYSMQEELDVFKPEWERAEFLSPVLYYNTLYALQILLWSFGDRTDDGKEIDEEAKSAINRSLAMLVYNYDSVPIIKQVLGSARYTFLLPGRGIFDVSDEKANCEYMDAGFLPLMTRLLVLFVVYGVGDRNMLEPIIRDLYVELLQRRNRTEKDFGALWSNEEIEIFSTQRAIQALTFYYAYAAGKELAERRSGGDIVPDGIALRNKTGMRVYLDLIGEPAKTRNSQSGESSVALQSPDFAALFKKQFAADLGDYLDKIKWLNVPPYEWDPAAALQTKAREFLESVFKAGGEGAFHDLAVPEMLIDSLLDLWKEPVDLTDKKQRRVRESEIKLLEKLYGRVNGASRAATV
jgi:hypothetical protein